jgi:hypothetical protein
VPFNISNFPEPASTTFSRIVGVLLLAAATIAIRSGTVDAQTGPDDDRAALKVTAFEPNRVDVEAGQTAIVLLHGTSLHELTEARFISGGTDAVGIVGTLASVDGSSAAVRVLRLAVAINAKPARYRVQLRVGRGIVATMARFDLTVTAPDLSPSIIDALFEDPVIENKPIRIRVRTASAEGLAHVRATMGEQTIEAPALQRDTRIAEFELKATGVGQRDIELVAVDVAGRTSEPLRRSIEIVPAIADLSVRSVRLDPEQPYAGQNVGAFVTVANTGTADVSIARGAVLLAWTVNDRDEREFAVGRDTTIEAGHERVYGPLIFEVQQAGSHPVNIRLDPSNAIVERDETNNEMTRLLAVGPSQHPDLTIVAVTFNPPQPSVNAPFVARVRIMNQGSAGATIFPPDRILAADGFEELRAGPQALVLPPGGLTELEVRPYPETNVAGMHRWTFHIDPDNRIGESVEDNNSYFAATKIGTSEPAVPDLVLESAMVRPDQPKVGAPMFLVLGVKNVGSVAVVLPAGYQAYEVYGPMGTVVPVRTQMVERLAPGQAYGMRTVDFTIDAAGSHDLQIRVDPLNSILEGNERNNTSSISVAVQ